MEIKIDPKLEIIRLACGQCGDMKDLHFKVDESGRLSVEIFESIDYGEEANDVGPTNLMQPITIIV